MVKLEQQTADSSTKSPCNSLNLRKNIKKNLAKRTGLSECIALQMKSTISGLATVAYFFEFILCTLASEQDEEGVSLSMVRKRSQRTSKFHDIITNANGFFREEETTCSSKRCEMSIRGRSCETEKKKILRLQNRGNLTKKKLERLKHLEAQLPWHISHLFEKHNFDIEDFKWYKPGPRSVAPIWLLNTMISHIGADTFKIREIAHLLYNTRKKFSPLMQNEEEILLQQTLNYVLKSGDKLISVIYGIIRQLEEYLGFIKSKKIKMTQKMQISEKSRLISKIMMDVWRESAAIMPHDVRLAF